MGEMKAAVGEDGTRKDPLMGRLGDHTRVTPGPQVPCRL